VSIGVVSITPTAASSAEVLLQRADAALYQAKTQGRNRAELAPD
jgi:two-component system, sensor histidine kinase LadS